MKQAEKFHLLKAITTNANKYKERERKQFSLCISQGDTAQNAFSCVFYLCCNSSNSNKILIKLKHVSQNIQWSHILHTDVILIAFLMDKMHSKFV